MAARDMVAYEKTEERIRVLWGSLQKHQNDFRPPPAFEQIFEEVGFLVFYADTAAGPSLLAKTGVELGFGLAMELVRGNSDGFLKGARLLLNMPHR